MAAPFCATLLAEFGAEVIKVEVPRTGDSLRTPGEAREGIPLLFLEEPRNKQTKTLQSARVPSLRERGRAASALSITWAIECSPPLGKLSDTT